MIDSQYTLISALKTTFPMKSWRWALPALRQEALLWRQLQEPSFREKVINVLGSNAPMWTPARVGQIALNEEFPSKLTWPLIQLPPELRQKASQCYSGYTKNASSAMTLTKAYLLALALREQYREFFSWQEVLTPCQPIEDWKTPFVCLFNLIDSHEEFLNALPIKLSVYVVLATPSPPEKTQKKLTSFLGIFPLQKQVAWLQEFSQTKPKLAASIAISLASIETSKKASTLELSQRAGLYQIAKRPTEALHLLEQASERHKDTEIQLATQVSGSTAQLKHIQLDSTPWQEVIAAARTPQGIEEHTKKIIVLLETLLEKEDLTAAKNLAENIATPYPNHPSLATALARIALSQGEKEQAEKLAWEALNTNAKNVPIPPSLSKIFFILNLFQATEKAAQHTLKDYPNHIETLITLAKAQNILGKFSEAVENAQFAVILAPKRVEIRRYLAQYLENENKWDTALIEREQILQTLEAQHDAEAATNLSPLVKDQHALARCALKANQPERAAQVCKNILNKNAEDGIAHTILGKSLSLLGNPQKATWHFFEATKKAPQLDAAWLALAKTQRQSGESEAAIQTLNAGVQAARQKRAIHFALGEIYQERQEYAQALTAFRKAANLVNKEKNGASKIFFQIQLRLGETLQQVGHVEKARQVFKKLVKNFPENAQAILRYGQILLSAGEPRGALPFLAQAMEKKNNNVIAYIAYAQAHLEIGINLEAAIEALKDATAREPLNIKALALLGEALATQGELEDALSTYQRALEAAFSPDSVWRSRIYLGLGKTALQVGKIKTALAALQEFTQENPRNLDARQLLTMVYQKANLNAEAVDSLQKALDIAPNDVENLRWAADFALGLGETQLAISAFYEIIQLVPEQANTYLLLGNVYAQNEYLDQAQQAFFKLYHLEHPPAAALYKAGDALFRLGNYTKAIMCLERATQRNEKNNNKTDLQPQIWSRLATCHHNKGDAKKALSYIDKAITAELETTAWRLQKAEILTAEERYQAALASLRHALNLSPKAPNLHYKAAFLYRHLGDWESALDHALQAERGYHAQGEENTNKRYHVLALAADLACATLQPERAFLLLDKEAPTILATLTDTQYTLLDGISLYAELLLAKNREIEAANILQQLLTLAPSSPRTKALQARLNLRQGNLKESQQFLAEGITIHEKLLPENIFTASVVYLALGKAAQKLQDWNKAIKLYQKAIKLTPTEKRAQLFLCRAMVLRAEFHRLGEALEILHHRPGSESLDEQAREIFQNTLCALAQAADKTSVLKWRLRGEAIFNPSQETANTLKRIASDKDNIAAQIAVLRHSHQKGNAIQLAKDYYHKAEDHLILNIQISLTLAQASPKIAYQAAQKALLTNQNQNLLPPPIPHALKAFAAEQKKEKEISRQEILSALSFWNNEPRWHAMAAKVAKSTQEGIHHLTLALALEPTYPGHSLALGRQYTQINPKEAISFLRQTTTLAPEEVEAWVLLAQNYKKANNERKAIDCARQAIKFSPSNAEARKLLAQIAFEQKEFAEAEKHLRILLKKDSQNVEILALLTQNLITQNRPREALETITNATSNEEMPLSLRLCQLKLIHKIEGASAVLPALNELAEQHPNDLTLTLTLASTWAEVGEQQKAIDIAQEALNRNNGRASAAQKAEIHCFIGQMLRQAGQLDQAVHHLHLATTFAPQHGKAYIELGRVEQNRRQYEKALLALNRAIEYTPRSSLAYYYAGLVLKNLKNYSKAERMLRQAAKLAPKDLRIRRQLGVLATLNLVHGGS